MMLQIFTIVLDGGEYLKRQLPIFEQLTIPWKWYVVEGAAGNTEDTSWCQPQESRLSNDGSHEYLVSIIGHPNIAIRWLPYWPNKTVMVNTALAQMHEPGVLLEIDSDEIWSAWQLEKIWRLFESDPSLGAIHFPCNYFVGPNLIAVGENCWGGGDTWIRAWRFRPGQRFFRHEPPVLQGTEGRCMTQQESAALGLCFDHFAWATEKQAEYKARFYGGPYANAVEGWRRLQAHTQFPVPLRQFFPWVPDDRTLVKRFREEGDVKCHDPQELKDTRCSTTKMTDSGSNAASNVQPTDAAVFAHSGDLGDCISALPAIRALGGGDLIITDGPYGQRESMKGARFDAIRPLLEAQPYINSVRWEDNPTGVTHDFRGFRKLKEQMHGVSLAQWQWNFIGLEGKVDLEPWLTVSRPVAAAKSLGLVALARSVAFARSLRYHNPAFPWRELLEYFGQLAYFIGLKSEHKAFEQEFGSILYVPTSELRTVAILFSCARLVIANQSAPFWIATGLGVPAVQETWSADPNSIVPRPNAIYSRTDYETSKVLEKVEKIVQDQLRNAGVIAK